MTSTLYARPVSQLEAFNLKISFHDAKMLWQFDTRGRYVENIFRTPSSDLLDLYLYYDKIGFELNNEFLALH